MHMLVFSIFGKYLTHHILCGHGKIVTIFEQYLWLVSKYFGNFTILSRNISTIISKFFSAVWVQIKFIVFLKYIHLKFLRHILPRNLIYDACIKTFSPGILFPHSTVILREYFENIPMKSCNITTIFIKLLERFLKYCGNLAMSRQNIMNEMFLQY